MPGVPLAWVFSGAGLEKPSEPGIGCKLGKKGVQLSLFVPGIYKAC